MGYHNNILPSALRQLDDVPKADQKRIAGKIERLTDEPRPAGVKRLQGEHEFFRLRSGNYRIIYTVNDSHRAVTVIRIGHRREVYRGL